MGTDKRKWIRFKKASSASLLDMLLRAQNIMQKVPLGKSECKARTKVIVSGIATITPGGCHAWVHSNVGLIRKPLGTF